MPISLIGFDFDTIYMKFFKTFRHFNETALVHSLAILNRVSERRTEHLLGEILTAQGWDLRRPPQGDLLRQQEYKAFPALAEIFKAASKTGAGSGLPEAILVDKATLAPLAVIEAKADIKELDKAVCESTEFYGRPCVDAGYRPLAIALAGTSEDQFDVRISRWSGSRWIPVTYDGKPINWIPNREDLLRLVATPGLSELRPTIPPPEVLAFRADEINRLLRESGVKDEFRPAVVAAVMLGLWSSQGNIRKDKEFILQDINAACKKAFIRAKKPDLAASLRIDEANDDLAVKARRIVSILERLNITVLTAEHDYLGQLYETFFRYTGGNTIGQYFTPRHVASAMADICEVSATDIVLDPSCGTGGFLIAAMNRLLSKGGISRQKVVEIVEERLIGFEKEPITAALCVANMILRGDGSSGVHRGDCFTSGAFPVNKASVALLNPPFPHEKTDVPSQKFIERALDALHSRGRLAVIIPTSILVKASIGAWREKILKNNSLVAVCQLPDELFQPYASSTTSIVVLEKGVPHDRRRKSVFVRVQYDGLTLKKGARVARLDGKNELPIAVDCIANRKTIPGFSGLANVSGEDEWAVGAYIPSTPASADEIKGSVDVLMRRLGSFYVRYADEVVKQRKAIAAGTLPVVNYREHITQARRTNSSLHLAGNDTIGGLFDVFYGMKELHSRDGIPVGESLIVSPTESYNGCYGWLEFAPLLKPPFVTVAQTGSIGEAFLQMEPCAVNDDCLVLLPKVAKNVPLGRLIVAAAVLHLEKWRFSYGRKLTPSRISEFPVPWTPALAKWVDEKMADIRKVTDAAIDAYE